MYKDEDVIWIVNYQPHSLFGKDQVQVKIQNLQTQGKQCYSVLMEVRVRRRHPYL